MNGPVGYLTRQNGGLLGDRGSHYSYVTAGNGLFVEAEGPYLGARVHLAEAEVRGLAAVESRLVLRHGPVPGYLFDLALSSMMADWRRERFVAIIWDSEYRIHIPEQERTAASIHYDRHPNTVVDLHSHGTLAGYFSRTDDRDEQGFGVYGVVGRLPDAPELVLRMGIYGHFQEVRYQDVFSGSCPVAETADLEAKYAGGI